MRLSGGTGRFLLFAATGVALAARFVDYLLVQTNSSRKPGRPGRSATAGVLAAIVFSLLSGCARVPPHRRGTLARRDMVLGRQPDLIAGEEHGQAYREGSSGGGSVKSGGCGCN